ncbi:MAG: toxin-antitoxin system YwqK family antitoxin [Phycisphaerales bacterium]
MSSANRSAGSRRPFVRISLASAVASLGLAALGCDGGKSAPPSAPAAADASQPSAAATKPADEVKIMKENWPNGKPKYWNEMRRNAAGKWDKNGLGRAYFDNGVLEREGMYKDGVRVGTWKYFNGVGSLLRTEERGGGMPES